MAKEYYPVPGNWLELLQAQIPQVDLTQVSYQKQVDSSHVKSYPWGEINERGACGLQENSLPEWYAVETELSEIRKEWPDLVIFCDQIWWYSDHGCLFCDQMRWYFFIFYLKGTSNSRLPLVTLSTLSQKPWNQGILYYMDYPLKISLMSHPWDKEILALNACFSLCLSSRSACSASRSSLSCMCWCFPKSVVISPTCKSDQIEIVFSSQIPCKFYQIWSQNLTSV